MKKQSAFILVSLLLSSLFLSSAISMVSAEDSNSFETNLESLESKLVTLHWVSYAPTHADPNSGLWPTENVLRADLQLLYDTGFRGIITYACDGILDQIPRIAKEIGFEGVIVGVYLGWTDNEQIANAKMISEYADGYCVGNEGIELSSQSIIPLTYGLEYLTSVMDEIRENTSKPVTTSEPGDHYLVTVHVPAASLREIGDWLLPNYAYYSFWHGNGPAASENLVVEYYNDLKALAPDKVILLKETGYPSAGVARSTEENQTEFFRLLNNTDVNFAYFEAFDQYWKTWAVVEPHWGLFDMDRSPKDVVSYLEEHFAQQGTTTETGTSSTTTTSPTSTTTTETSILLIWSAAAVAIVAVAAVYLVKFRK